MRELTYRAEEFEQSWAAGMKRLLQEMKTATDTTRAQGAPQVAANVRESFIARYQALLAQGLAANPPPRREPGRRGRRKQSPERNLLQRLWFQQEQVLTLLDDLAIPFDNNQAVRDLRLLTTQQKFFGCFRSEAGSKTLARLRGYFSTLWKQRVALLAALHTLFTDSPLYPALG